MWKIVREIGKEKLYKCTECGYQTIATRPPAECPSCGESSHNKPRSIDLSRSSIDIDDEEIGVYEFERETPVYKLWYFWLVLILTIVLAFGGMSVIKSKFKSQKVDGTDYLGTITFTPPTGWERVSDTDFIGPGETSEISIISHKVSRFSDVEEFGQLISELTEVEEVKPRKINGIDGRYLEWRTRKIVDKEEVFTNYARYVFISKDELFVVTYKSYEDSPEVFETFLNSIGKA